jgi:sugar phosphate isomerase/epimerase
LNNQAYEFIKAFSEKIVHVHLHDNNADYDYHLGIGKGNINWVNIIRAFKRMRYPGIFIIESEDNIQESIKIIKSLLKVKN